MFKKTVLFLAIGYTICLAIISLIHLQNLPEVGLSFGDKIFHFLAYFVLSFLWFYTFLLFFQLKYNKAIIYAAVLSVIFGIIIEVLQGSLTDYRALDVYDIIANTLGVLLVSVALWFKKIFAR